MLCLWKVIEIPSTDSSTFHCWGTQQALQNAVKLKRYGFTSKCNNCKFWSAQSSVHEKGHARQLSEKEREGLILWNASISTKVSDETELFISYTDLSISFIYSLQTGVVVVIKCCLLRQNIVMDFSYKLQRTKWMAGCRSRRIQFMLEGTQRMNPVEKMMKPTVSVIRWLILAWWLYISDLPPQCCSLILLSPKTPLTFPKVLLSKPCLDYWSRF